MVLVDVRPPERHAAGAPAGAVNVPIYVLSKPLYGGFNPGSLLKAALLAANGVTPTEENQAFLADLQAAAGGKGVALLCETGGALAPTAQFRYGKASRSLQAAFRALEDGGWAPARVTHVEGGVYAWAQAGLPFDGEYDGKEAGRTPGVVQKK